MEPTQKDIDQFIEGVKQHSEYDFSDYSIKSFSRRLEKLMSDNRMTVAEIVAHMAINPKFLELSVKNITVNTTELFRDPPIWQSIRKMVIPRFSNEEFINVWHAGCSTGQEVFSMLITLEQSGLLEKSKSFASDLNTDVIDVAKSGVYKYREIDEYIDNYAEATEGFDVPELTNYMEISRKRSTIKIKPYLTKKPTYEKHDLVSFDNPFDRSFHIIFCRNVLIYFNHELQNRIFEFFHQNLQPGGALIIGKHEGILGEVGNKFERYGTIYIKK